MTISIKQLDSSHQAVYRKVRLECLQHFPENFGTTYEEEILKPELFFEQCLRNRDAGNFIFGVFDNQTCIGICGFMRETKTRTSHRGEIIQLYISPDYQGQGIGKKLLQNVIDKAFEMDEIEQITLAVIAANISAMRLYYELGFEEYGFVKNCFKLNNSYLDLRLMIKYK